ncbi:hypothetical protein [Micromonospora costi]|uniref:Uncharacterized protein n=1 Tax=Micromonospora costi TaxID=1530042 RepID=A0A3B0A5T7_9ACTN|nr:hypothetical protein [Micromonospora costi]RKN55975.1 hypothetical protein D7193_15430 [Micromonospora costi]
MTLRTSVTGRSWHRDPDQRPAHWAPAGEFRLYRAWGDLPPEKGLWPRLLAWLLGAWQHLLYIGITERTAPARWAEHMDRQVWAPQVACWERDPRVWRTRVEVEAAEAAAIIAEGPIHNVVHNRPGSVARRRRHLPRHVVRTRLRATGWLGLWFALVALTAVGGVEAGGSWRQTAVISVLVATAVTVWLRWRRRR